MPFKKGENWNGNANGRPKGSFRTLTPMIEEELKRIPEGEKETYRKKFIRVLLDKAIKDKDTQTMKLVLNYVDGLPVQHIDHTTGGEAFGDLLTDEQKQRLAKEILNGQDIKTSNTGSEG